MANLRIKLVKSLNGSCLLYTSGRIGVKVWIYKGEILSQTLRTTPRTMDLNRPPRERRQGDRRGRDGRQGGGYNRNAGGRGRGDRAPREGGAR